jgi:tetrahydromethanopterin S-methyltransferase subunit B
VTVGIVFLLGLLLVLAPFAVPMPDSSETYEATAVDPATDTALVASETSVRNLTSLADTASSRRTIERAVAGKRVTVTSDDSPLSRLDSASGYAVYQNDYYQLRVRPAENGTESSETTASATTRTPTVGSSTFEPFTVTLRPVSGETVLAEMAVSYEEAGPQIRRVVDEGEATVNQSNESGPPVVVGVERVPSVVVRGNTYYVLGRASELAPLAEFAAFYVRLSVLPALQRLGVTYVGFAVGIYGLTAARGRSDPLTGRTALGLVGGVTLLQVAVAFGQVKSISATAPVVVSSLAPIVGSLSSTIGRLGAHLLFGIVAAASTLPVSSTLLVATSWNRYGVDRRVVLAVAGVFGALLFHAMLSGVMAGTALPAVFTMFVGMIGLVTALPVVVLGYIHAADTVSNGKTA